ncbi:MAG: hypothetical protein QFB87_04790 [Patescibacteria group bacterium]|nr:hypothetical protein [Patescibacteria group bacterium]
MSTVNRESPLQAVYTAYFNGLILQDLEDLRWAGNQLQSRNGCLMQSAGIDADMLASRWEDEPAQDLQGQLDFTICNAVRSYEYSGLSFDGEQVLLTTRLCGFSRRWLKQVLSPTTTVLRDVLGIESAPQRKLMRRQAYAALGAVGMLHPLQRSFDRFI